MRLKGAALMAACMTWSVASVAQELVGEGMLRGQWAVDKARASDFIRFGPDGEFASGYVYTPKLPPKASKESKPASKEGMVPEEGKPAVKTVGGAYKVGAQACTASGQQGNLFIAQGTERCCFKAYMLGKTLVLDELRAGPVSLLPLCHSKTLTRFGSEKS